MPSFPFLHAREASGDLVQEGSSVCVWGELAAAQLAAWLGSQCLLEPAGNLKALRQLHLHSNLLVTVPASLASLPNLSRLDLRNNCLRAVPPEIQTLPFVHLRGNPLGETEPSPQAGNCRASASARCAQLSPRLAQCGANGFGLGKGSRGQSDQYLLVWCNYEVVTAQAGWL